MKNLFQNNLSKLFFFMFLTLSILSISKTYADTYVYDKNLPGGQEVELMMYLSTDKPSYNLGDSVKLSVTFNVQLHTSSGWQSLAFYPNIETQIGVPSDTLSYTFENDNNAGFGDVQSSSPEIDPDTPVYRVSGLPDSINIPTDLDPSDKASSTMLLQLIVNPSKYFIDDVTDPDLNGYTPKYWGNSETIPRKVFWSYLLPKYYEEEATDDFMIYSSQADLNRGYTWQVNPNLQLTSSGKIDYYGNYNSYCTATIGTEGWPYCSGNLVGPKSPTSNTVYAYYCDDMDNYIYSPAAGENMISQGWNYNNDLPRDEACLYTGDGGEYPMIYNNNTSESSYYTDPNTGMTSILPALSFIDPQMYGYYNGEKAIGAFAHYNSDGSYSLINYDDITNLKKYISETYASYLPNQLVFSVPFTLNLPAPTCSETTSTATANGTWRSVQVGVYHYIDGSSNGYDWQYSPAGTKNITYLDISPNTYNGNSFFLWNSYAGTKTSLPSTMDLSSASYAATNVTDLFKNSRLPCSNYSGACVTYDYFVNNDGFYETLWYFTDGIHTTQQNPLIDLSNQESTESSPGYIGGSQPGSVGAMSYTYTTTSSNCAGPTLLLK